MFCEHNIILVVDERGLVKSAGIRKPLFSLYTVLEHQR